MYSSSSQLNVIIPPSISVPYPKDANHAGQNCSTQDNHGVVAVRRFSGRSVFTCDYIKASGLCNDVWGDQELHTTERLLHITTMSNSLSLEELPHAYGTLGAINEHSVG